MSEEEKTPEVDPDIEAKIQAAVTAKENELLKAMNEQRSVTEDAWRQERERERREMMELMGGGRQKEEEPEEENPYEQSTEPAEWAEWQAAHSAQKAVMKLARETLQPAADQLRQELEEVRELGSVYTREKITSDPYYSRFEKEIEGHLSRLPKNQQRDPRAIKEVLTYVKGQHIDDILTEERQKSLNMSETAGGIGRVREEGGVRITPRIERLASKFGMEAKEYAEALIAQGVDPDTVK